MNKNFRLLALLMALVMLFSACTVIGEHDTATESASETESVSATATESESESDTPAPTETETVSEAETVTETETETETEVETMDPYRASISRSREEMEEMLVISDEVFNTAEEQLKAFEAFALVNEDYEAADALYLTFEDTFFHISTQVSIANIIYYMDMSVTEASERYLDLFDKYGDVYNLYADACKNLYKNSPIRDQLFADWTEQEIKQMLDYDPETLELQKANEALLVELNDLPAGEFDDRAAEIYALLVTNNNRIATLSGYDNYYDYASAEIYSRDYSRAEVEAFSAYTVEHLVPNLTKVMEQYSAEMNMLNEANYMQFYYYVTSPFDQLSKNYLQKYIDSFEGSMHDGMAHMFENRNVVFSNKPNSHPTAFQSYLDELEMPFCLFGSQGQDTSTIAHEMGHYYAALYNDVGSYDLAETQSQGNEMLLLEFLKREMPFGTYNALVSYTSAVYFTQIIACVIIDEFEREVYALESVEGYGTKEFDAIMTKVCEKFGGAAFVSGNLGDMYGYWRQVATNNPVYYISYAVSMTAALNIYSETVADRATGREIYRVLVEEVKEEDGFLKAVTGAGLTSPFTEETFTSILDSILK